MPLQLLMNIIISAMRSCRSRSLQYRSKGLQVLGLEAQLELLDMFSSKLVGLPSRSPGSLAVSLEANDASDSLVQGRASKKLLASCLVDEEPFMLDLLSLLGIQ